MECAEVAHRCFRCGYCKFTDDYQDFNCPSYRAFGLDTYAPGGRMWLINAWLNHDIKTSKRFGEILYSCATCGNCEKHCVFDFKNDILVLFEAAKSALVEEGIIPSAVRDYFKAMTLYGNPYKQPRGDRGKWAKDTDIEAFTNQEYLFYVGDVGSYDERVKRMAKTVASLLIRGGISLGIMGNEEISDGNDVKVLGEEALFNELAQKNIQQFNEMGVKKVITLDPHSFNIFTKQYPQLGGRFRAWHYTQVLAEIVKDGRLPLSRYNFAVTYHDPCYLGRHNGIYEAPRGLLRSIPSLKLVEMVRQRENSFCCGGGGGNFFTDMLGNGRNAPARLRVREALSSGSEVLVVACPMCLKMLEEAVKSEEVESRIRVVDVAEVVQDAVLA